MADDVRGPSSAATRERVAGARERQRRRLRGSGALCNGDMDGRLTRQSVRLDADSSAGLVGARERTGLSGRGHDRVLRVARTIADLADRDAVVSGDVEEALSYRFDGWERLAA